MTIHLFDKKLLSLFITVLLFISVSSAEELPEGDYNRDRNAITLIDQQDREVAVKKSDPKTKKGYSYVTGLKSSNVFQPVLVELNNENGGIFSVAPEGITQASILYEYQMLTNGTTGLCALFQDELPSSVGPIGNASVGGLLIQDDWKCGYVINDIPKNSDGSVSQLGQSIQAWIDSYDLINRGMIFPGAASKVKAWKKYFKEDNSLFIDQNKFVDTKGIVSILNKNKISASAVPYTFAAIKEKQSNEENDLIPVKEVDIRLPSKAYSSGFIYNDEDGLYYRWIGANNQYGDVTADKQLTVANVIVQRVNYNTSNGLMAPVTIGKGNADIFVRGCFIEGYWVRENADDHTRFYDIDGNPVELTPGNTFISLMTTSTAVVIYNY